MERKEVLQSLADNPLLLEMIRKLLEDKFSIDSLKADDADMILGQMVRARLVGLKAVDEAFREIEQYKSSNKTVDKKNPVK